MSPPPGKKMKFQRLDVNSKKENKEVTKNDDEEVRKRKRPFRKQCQKQFTDLNTDVLWKIVDYLPLEDLCSVNETSSQKLSFIATRSFLYRANNIFPMCLHRRSDFELLGRIFKSFGDCFSISAIGRRL